MMRQAPPEPRKRPKQERARQSVAAIEQACLKILEQEGPERLTTNRIAEVAGVNIASLYQYFPNKEAIVAVVYSAKLAREAEALLHRGSWFDHLASQSLEDTLRAVVHFEVELHRRLFRLHGQFCVRYHRLLDPVTEVNRQAVSRRQPSQDDWFPTVLERHRSRLRVTDLRLASFLATRAMEGAIRCALEERPELLDSQEFREELLAMLLGFLEARPRGFPVTSAEPADDLATLQARDDRRDRAIVGWIGRHGQLDPVS